MTPFWSTPVSDLAYVDRGFGFLKAGRAGSVAPLVTQSLVTPGSTLPGLSEDQLTMTYRGVTYLVGATAAKQGSLDSHADLADAAPISEESRLLYLASLAYLAGETGTYRFHLVAGLPVDTWEQQHEALRRLLLTIRDETVQLRIGNREIRVALTVEEAMVMPQPLGSAMDLLLDDQGSLEHAIQFSVEIGGKVDWPADTVASWRWCVLDIGFNTLNTYVLDDMEPVRRYCTSPKLGMAYAYQLIGRQLGGRSEIEVDQLLRRGMLHGYEAALAELGRQISRVVRSWNDPHLAFYLITGGGAELLFPHILPEAPARVLAREPQHANGRGYLKAGMQRWPANASG